VYGLVSEGPSRVVCVRPGSDPVETVRAALAELDQAHDAATTAVTAAPDLDSALAAVNELAAHMRRLSDADAELRTRIIGHVWEAERLSLAALAERVGISKSRADQLIQAVKKSRGQDS
jgi:hypothetical protein